MSFIGSIPSDVRKIVAAWTPCIQYPVINICAGNFTVPAILRSTGYTGEIHTCDVTLYTSALGAYLTDKPLDLAIKQDCPEHIRDLVNIKNPLEAAASIALLYDLRQVWKIRNPFQQRTVDEYRRKWPQLIAKVKEKLKGYKRHLGAVGYEPKDGFKVLAEADPHHTIIAAPPIYKGDYEKLDALLTTAILWNPPAYKPMLDKDLDIYRLIRKFEDFLVIIYKDMPDVYEIIGQPSAIILPRGRGGNTLRVITHRVPRKMIIRHIIKSDAVGPFFSSERQVNGREKIELARITVSQSIRMNELFSSAHINTFTGGVADSLVFLLDKQIIGKADFCKSSFKWKIPGEDAFPAMIYLMSDLVVPNCTPKLAKLILLCLLSRNVKQIMDLNFAEDFKYVLTTAFTKNPSSMKYRGIFKIHKRMKDPNGYRINYYAPFGNHDLKGALKKWYKKYK